MQQKIKVWWEIHRDDVIKHAALALTAVITGIGYIAYRNWPEDNEEN